VWIQVDATRAIADPLIRFRNSGLSGPRSIEGERRGEEEGQRTSRSLSSLLHAENEKREKGREERKKKKGGTVGTKRDLLHPLFCAVSLDKFPILRHKRGGEKKKKIEKGRRGLDVRFMAKPSACGNLHRR